MVVLYNACDQSLPSDNLSDHSSSLDDFFTIEQAVEKYKVSTTPIYNRVRLHSVPTCRVAGKIYYSKVRLEEIFLKRLWHTRINPKANASTICTLANIRSEIDSGQITVEEGEKQIAEQQKQLDKHTRLSSASSLRMPRNNVYRFR